MLLLGSASPRRQQILFDLGITFSSISPAVDEIHHEYDPEHTVIENSRLKLDWCIQRHPHAHILSADTVVVFEGTARGKANSHEEAAEWLASYSNKSMSVITAMGYFNGNESHFFSDTASVHFKKLDKHIITDYLNLVDPTDKAGGYNIDEYGDMIIESIDGSYSTIMGLCKERVMALKL